MWDAPERYWSLKIVLGNGQGIWDVGGGNPFSTGVPIDLNGDGYTDIAYSESSKLSTRISNGKEFGTVYTVSTNPAFDWKKSIVLDWNGDGMEDLLAPHSNGYWYVAISDGFKLLAPTSTGIPTGSPIHVFATDSDGDGLHDIAYVKSSGAYAHRTHSGVKPDLLKDVVDGNGNTVEFHYASLSDSAVYTRGTGAALPVADYLEPRLVVKTLEQSTGTGSTYELDYVYEGAKANVEGRGIGGFERRTVTDSRTGNKIIESYHTDFPYRGRIKKRELRLSDNTLIQEVSKTWSKKTAGTGYQDYHYPYVSAETEKNFEAGGTYNGSQINTITTTSTVDSYGTPYDVTTTTIEHSSANGAMPGTAFTRRTYTPTSQLHNVASTWCIGRRAQVQHINSHTGTYGSSITRTANYTWDTGNNCRVTREVVEPSSANYRVITDLEYDTFGNVDKRTVTGVNAGASLPSRVTTIDWGTNGRYPVTITNPLGQGTTANWDSETGDLLSVTDPNGLVRSWLYDGFNRQTRETAPNGTYTAYSFTACTSANAYCGSGYSVVKTRVRASARTTTGTEIRYDDVFLDALDRTVETANQIIGGGTTKTRTVYDASGRMWKRSSPTLSTATLYYTETTFDALGRPTRTSRPIHDGTASLQYSYTYYEGLKVRERDAENHETHKILDALGRVHQSHDNLSHYQQFDFDAFGSVKRVQDCLVSTCDELTTMTYAYGADAFKVQSDDMSLGLWNYSFNSLGEMTAYNDAKTGGSLPGTATAAFTWDKLGRPLTRVESEGTTTWTWGTSAAAKNIGKLAWVFSPGHNQSFTYDSYGRVSRHRRVGGGTYDIDYVYNPSSGLLDSVQYPASTGGYRFRVLQEYDRGILKRVKRSDSGQTVYWEAQTQDAFGNILEEDLGNGSTTVRGFDGVTGRVDYIQTDKGGTSLQNLSYAWDKVGNLLQRKDWRQSGYPTENFAYDSLNRLTDVDVSGAATSSLNLSFDANGNIKSKDDVGGSNWVYHGTNKHAVTTAGANSYSYDANGNMISRKGDPIVWTSYNYPSVINDGPRTYEYSYDADRQKWKQVYDDGGNVETTYFAGRIFEKNVNSSDTEHRHHVMANGRAVALFVERTSGSDYTRYFTQDHLGSIDGVIQDDGITTYVNQSFSAYGERRDPADWVGGPSAGDLTRIAGTTDRGYTDHISLEKSALVHMNGRVYDAEIGRFLSPDPYVADPYHTQGFNRYAYVYNNPMRYVDPSGFCTEAVSFKTCVKVIASVASFLFGRDSGPPPPDFCKDNTQGCSGGPTAPISSTQPMAQDIKVLPLEESSAWGAVFSGVLDVVPLVSQGKGIIQVATGRDLVTGERVSRLGEVVGLIPGVKQVKTAVRAGEGVRAVARRADVPNSKPPNLSPQGAGRSGAFNEAKRQAGIPTSQQPSRVLPNVDRRGNPQPGRIYEYEVPAPGGGTRTVRIRDDAGGSYYGRGDPQNRGPHFNDEAGNHYDYGD